MKNVGSMEVYKEGKKKRGKRGIKERKKENERRTLHTEHKSL